MRALATKHLTKIVLAFLVGVAVLGTIGSILTNPEGMNGAWWSGLLQNFSTEVMGSIMTFVLFEIVINGWQRYIEKRDQLEKEAKGSIFKLVQSTSLKERQYIVDKLNELGMLAGADFQKAYLVGLNMGNMDLHEINLSYANLENVNLQQSNLRGANLNGAELGTANMYDVDATGANLADSTISSVTQITLPDGTQGDDETDMRRFTNFGHIEFEATEKVVNAIRANMRLRPIDYIPF